MTPATDAPAFVYEDRIGPSIHGDDRYYDPGHYVDQAALEDEFYWHLHRRDVLLDRMREHCPSGIGRFIELGCGTGTVATHLNEHGYHVDYADVHEDALRYARQRAERRLGTPAAPRRFVRIDITTQALPGEYNGALLLDVLEHLPDDRAVLTRVRDTLVAGASDPMILFTVPAFPFLWSPWDDLNRHRRRYTKRSVVDLATACGLRVVRTTYFFFPLFFAAAAVKGLRTLRGRGHASSASDRITELAEARSYPPLNRGMLRLLAIERAWLARRDLPLGTSLVCVARA